MPQMTLKHSTVTFKCVIARDWENYLMMLMKAFESIFFGVRMGNFKELNIN